MEQIQNAVPTGVGAILRDARENMGMSVEEVAIRLKFAPRQIIALEEEKYAQLPEMAFVRGFVRSYARLVQVDETSLLEALPGAAARELPPVNKVREDVLPGESATRTQNLIWLAAAFAVAVIIGILAWKYDAGNAVTKPSAGAKPETAAPQNMPSAPAAATAQPGEEIAAKPETQPKGTADTPSTKPAVAAPVKPAHQPAHAASAVAAAHPASGVARTHSASAVSAASDVVAAKPRKARLVQPLRLEFDEDSWVEVQDGSGKTLLATLGKQGTSKIVSGAPPISVTIGNAKGVRVYYKNEPRELGAVTDQNTAHLRLE